MCVQLLYQSPPLANARGSVGPIVAIELHESFQKETKPMHRYLIAFLLGAALIGPVGVRAGDNRERDEHREKRYYDRERKDWHEWNEKEQRAYRHWLEERREDQHDWARAKRREQQEYWKWRHEHPNTLLFGVEVH
jgi:hypothetical protein